MALYQATPELLGRFRTTVGELGHITGPYRGRLYHWQTKKHSDIDEVMAALWPWLGRAKRVQLHVATAGVGRSLPVACGTVGSPEAAPAWAAGFFDGEGFIGASVSGRRRSIRISIAQASANGPPETLLRMRAALGTGRIRGPFRMASPWSKLPQYEWNAASFEEVQHSVALIWPWLGPVKRAQARSALVRYRHRSERS